MRIGASNLDVGHIETGAVQPDRASRAPATSGSTPAGAGVSVEVSSTVKSLGRTGSGSGIDEAKVASMREAIANGTFTVDAGAVADKMLANAQEMLSRTKG
ncbi:flagellar biosynthesis anti-sigma factor FlgM [uncultured Pseudacidovorax sp.]|uniref:flagellar biosynthesis anti-sigma factor FlgM n=1 Tax=uncultured Pseudacidovorax sp. TaxID=679313 RepID=UPI0025D2ACB4|nr:flagellar biosynthesis anti-sigma factor FlgM [uncultured Pseudacidovorax sp.]